MNIDGHTEPQLVLIVLLQVFVRELHNSFVSDTYGGGIKEERYAESNIIINDYILCSLLPHQLKKIHQDTRSCVVVSVISLPKVYIPHYYHGVIVI